MFIKITRTNAHGESVEAIINTDMIISVSETHQDPIRLYDSEGNLVEEKAPAEKAYCLILKGGITSHLKQADYDLLAKALLK